METSSASAETTVAASNESLWDFDGTEFVVMVGVCHFVSHLAGVFLGCVLMFLMPCCVDFMRIDGDRKAGSPENGKPAAPVAPVAAAMPPKSPGGASQCADDGNLKVWTVKRCDRDKFKERKKRERSLLESDSNFNPKGPIMLRTQLTTDVDFLGALIDAGATNSMKCIKFVEGNEAFEIGDEIDAYESPKSRMDTESVSSGSSILTANVNEKSFKRF